MSFAWNSREQALARMGSGQLDLLVIGGGITGAGIALDAAARGMAVGLIERQDFAAGTSSRSTKLVHGGLRYLKQLEIAMVAEVGRERAIVYENAPHVTKPVRMVLPFYEGGSLGRFATSIGLRLYDALAGVRQAERRTMLTAPQVLEQLPMLRSEGLKGAGSYVEYRTDDARLTLEVLKKAVQLGLLAANYACAERLLYDNERIAGVVVRDELSGQMYEIYARSVVNATGPWGDELRELDGSRQGKQLFLTKGVHIVLPKERLPLNHAIYFDVKDGRMMFAIPREDKVYVGTTDTYYSEDKYNPGMTATDRDYILTALNQLFPAAKLGSEDVESSWSGLRPLIGQEGKAPSSISRKDEIFVSQSGLITIAGGKLTGYRKMAEAVVWHVLLQQQAGAVATDHQSWNYFARGESVTRYLSLSGGDVGGSAGLTRFVTDQIKQGIACGLSKEDAGYIAERYGSNAPLLWQRAIEQQELAARYGLPLYLCLMLSYGMEEEMAVREIDFWIRRTGALYFNIAFVRKLRSAVHSYMSEIQGWEKARKQVEQELLNEALDRATKVLDKPSV